MQAWTRRACLGGLLALAAGCAPLPVRRDEADTWTGRLSVRSGDNPPRLWAATFRLEGTPKTGRLFLYGPLGASVAQAEWAPGQAVLDTGREQHRYDDLDALTEGLLGERVPMAALYDWLTLAPVRDVPGWSVDASQRERGLLRADRLVQPGLAPLLLTVLLDRRAP